MLTQDTSIDIKPKTSTVHLSSLDDHDYCSKSVKKEENNSNCNHKNQISSSCTSSNNNNNKTSNQAPASMDHELLASKSTTTNTNLKPNHSLDHYSNLNNKLRRTNSDDNLSDSSSAISSSSDSERGGLVIAQDRVSKPQTSNTTSAGQKRQRGRPPKRETDFSIQTMPTQPRAKRPRQNVSVTDKSEWITGEEQIDSILSEQGDDEPSKRKRVISRDVDHLYEEDLSSDYSSSDAEQDDESEEDEESEDDPNALWCICRRPYDNKFMICCDVCKDWFHGDCVNVTKAMGDRIVKEKREWFCKECENKLESGIPRDAIPQKIVKKEKQKKKKHPKAGKRGRGRPRKSEIGAREIGTRSSARNSRKSLDSKFGIDNGRAMRRGSAKPEARIETFDEFEDSQRLKVLIKERKKEFFYKRQLAEQQKAVKRNELGLGRRAITADLGGSLDSLACSTNTPNMNNLPINIKSDHGKERHKPPIVIQINTKKEPGSDPSTPKIVTAIVKPSKKLHTPEISNSSLNDLFTVEPIQISKKQKTHDDGGHHQSGDSGSQASADKRTHSTSSASSKTIDKSSGAAEQVVHKKKRKDSESSVSNGSNPAGSKLIRQKIKETLIARGKQIKDVNNISEDKIETLSTDIENQLNQCFKEGTQKYLNKFRSLIFNLRDPKNQCLVTNVLSGDITPSRLVRMSPDEMASNELAKWRERENKHSIELIKRDAQLAAQQVIVKKTHKGEEVISAPLLDDSTNSETTSQDHPTTPTKSPKDLFKNKLILDGSGNISISPTTKNAPETKSPTNTISSEPTKSIKFDDKIITSPTKIFDKDAHTESISRDSVIDPKEQRTPDSDETKPDAEKSALGPKRFSVTIQSSLNPSDLSRLREPLVMPVKTNTTDETNDYDSMTPPEHQTPSGCRDADDGDEGDERDDQEADDEDQGDEDIDDVDNLEYDPEAMPPGLGELNNTSSFDKEAAPPGLGPVGQASKQSASPIETTTTRVKDIWSGTITMPDIAKFKSIARIIDGDSQFMNVGDLKPELTVCGRIAIDQMHAYIKKLRTTTKNQILIIQLFPQESEDKASFNRFFDYLYSRNRYGVVQTNLQILKDFYILPLHERGSVPEVLKPLKNTSFDRRNNPNCLIGLLVRSKR